MNCLPSSYVEIHSGLWSTKHLVVIAMIVKCWKWPGAVVISWMCYALWHTNSHTVINTSVMARIWIIQLVKQAVPGKTKPMLVPAYSCVTMPAYTPTTLKLGRPKNYTLTKAFDQMPQRLLWWPHCQEPLLHKHRYKTSLVRCVTLVALPWQQKKLPVPA